MEEQIGLALSERVSMKTIEVMNLLLLCLVKERSVVKRNNNPSQKKEIGMKRETTRHLSKQSANLDTVT